MGICGHIESDMYINILNISKCHSILGDDVDGAKGAESVVAEQASS